MINKLPEESSFSRVAKSYVLYFCIKRRHKNAFYRATVQASTKDERGAWVPIGKRDPLRLNERRTERES